MKLIYVAGPLFSTHERWYLERVAEALEAAGYRTFLPHRDADRVKLASYEGKSTKVGVCCLYYLPGRTEDVIYTCSKDVFDTVRTEILAFERVTAPIYTIVLVARSRA